MRKIVLFVVDALLFVILYGCAAASPPVSHVAQGEPSREGDTLVSQGGAPAFAVGFVLEQDPSAVVEEGSTGESWLESEVLLAYPADDIDRLLSFDITLSQCPDDAVYCDISTLSGLLSEKKLILDEARHVTYFFRHEGVPFSFDAISFDFYDAGNRLVDQSLLVVQYADASEQAHPRLVVQRIMDWGSDQQPT